MQAQYLPGRGELSALIKQNHYRREVEGRSRSVVQDYGCDREREEKLGWESRAEEVGFEVLPKRCNRGTISYMERVPKYILRLDDLLGNGTNSKDATELRRFDLSFTLHPVQPAVIGVW